MKYWLWLSGLVAVVLALLAMEPSVISMVIDNGQNIRINEVMFSGSDVSRELFGDAYDYIELHNYGELSIDLSGYGLSDDPKEPFKFTFDGVTLKAGSYLLLVADQTDVESDYLKTGFSLKAGEEGVYLTHPEEGEVSKVLADYPKDKMSYGYHEELKTYKWLLVPTPGKANSHMYVEDRSRDIEVAKPISNYPSGAYGENIFIEIEANEGQVVYYTLDGSKPDENGFLYEGPFELTTKMNPNKFAGYSEISYMTPPGGTWGRPNGSVYKSAILRFVAYEPGNGTSEVVTNTYFLDEDFKERYTLPIISLVGDPDDFFDPKTGIYVLGDLFQERDNPNVQGDAPANYNQRGRAWEREVDFTYMTPQGDVLHQQVLGVRTHGAWSRANPHKGLRLFAREEYGEAEMAYPFIENLTGVGTGQPIEIYDRLLVRSSGNDWSYTLFRDAFMQDVSVNLPFVHKIDSQGYQPTILFLNGEYWGIHNIREAVDPYKIGRHYDIDPEDITIAEADVATQRTKLDVGDESIAESYNQMIVEIRDMDLSTPEGLAYVDERVDIQNFAQFMVAQTYLGNTDWPGNNMRYWRMNEADDSGLYGHDGKWRYVLFDTDFGFHIYEGMENNVNFDTIEFAKTPYGPSWPNPEWSTVLFRKLLENESFVNQFVNTYATMLSTTYQPLYLIRKIQEYERGILVELGEHRKRYNHMETWTYEIGRMEEFAQNRTGVMWKILDEHFDTGDQVKIEVGINDEAAGQVLLDQFIATDWRNPYIAFYLEKIPVTLTAQANTGYKFVGWEGVEEIGQSIQFYPVEGMSIKAVFEKE